VYLAFVLLVRSRIDRMPLSLALDGVLVGLGTATVAAALVLPALVADLGGSFAETATNLAYPLLDLLLLATIVGSLLLFRWRPPRALWWLAAGLLVFVIIDWIYLIQAARDSYQAGGWLDALWVIAVAMIAVAPGSHSRARNVRVPPIWLPLATPLAAAAAAMIVLGIAGYVAITPAASYLAVATLVAALVRVALAFLEAHRFAEHAHLVRTDDLTSLPNRRGFYDKAARLVRNTIPLAAPRDPLRCCC
jgi:hypothetical protein